MGSWKDHADGWMLAAFVVYCNGCDEVEIANTVERDRAEAVFKKHGWVDVKDVWQCELCTKKAIDNFDMPESWKESE